jgi:hypothetical protein
VRGVDSFARAASFEVCGESLERVSAQRARRVTQLDGEGSSSAQLRERSTEVGLLGTNARTANWSPRSARAGGDTDRPTRGTPPKDTRCDLAVNLAAWLLHEV